MNKEPSSIPPVPTRPLRVLHLFGRYLGPTENWAYRLLSNTPGVHHVIAAQSFLKTNFYHPDFSYIDFPLHNIDQPRKGWWDRALNTMLGNSIKFHAAYLAYYLEEIDLVHAHFGNIGMTYRRLPRKLKVPFAVSFYGRDYSLPTLFPRRRKTFGKFLQQVDQFFCEGSAGVEKLVDLGCSRDRAEVIHLGIEPDPIPFHARKKLPGQLDLLQMATWREKKGHRYTLDAFRAALHRCPAMTLTLVGGDPHGLRDELIAPARDLIADGKLILVDSVEVDALYDFLGSYHAFIHPSCTAADGDCEGGAPVVLLDAQATGMPVIATRHCDIPEEVADGTTGLLVDEKDVEGLAGAIERFYAMDQKAYEDMAHAARRHVCDHYDIRDSGKKLGQCYRELVARS